MYETEERVVNLADPGGLRYLKAQVVLEFAVDGAPGSDALAPEVYKERQEELKQELLGRAPVIDDLITTILSSKTSAELLTPDGKASLKQELKDRLSEAAGDKHLINVYLTKLIIQ